MRVLLETFPQAIREELEKILHKGRILQATTVEWMLEVLQIPLEQLMIRLLPIAAQYAIVPISNFPVGVVAQGRAQSATGAANLYMGANIEFAGQALSTSIHAEQSVVINAWIHGESHLRSLAASATPCGYCRQFLQETIAEEPLTLLLTGKDEETCISTPFSHYLPNAFAPHDLGFAGGLLRPAGESRLLLLKNESKDPLILQALQAARRSYAPYTKNYAGCALKTSDGAVYTGRYAENAAYNPSISPLQSAIAFMNMNHPLHRPRTLDQAALVEVPTLASQRDATEVLISKYASDITLQYHQAQFFS